MVGRRALAAAFATAAMSISMVLGPAAQASAVVAPAGAQSPGWFAHARIARSDFGLPTDDATLARLASKEDVGSRQWGIPMTAVEEASLDLVGRMTFANAVAEGVLPYAEKLPTFAGAWIDERQNGSLVIMLTQPDAATEATIRTLLPGGSRGVRFGLASTPYAALVAAAEEVVANWSAALPDVTLYQVGVDTASNQVAVEVPALGVSAATAAIDSLELARGVRVVVIAGEPSQDATCTDRDHCYSPLKAGDIIRNGSSSSTGTCTMAWHILVGSDKQFMTAGHCGRAYLPSVNWYHQGYGLIGSDQSNLEDLSSTKKDEMRIQMPDAQASALVYEVPAAQQMVAATLPVVGMAVCGSLGISNTISCGTVTSTWTSWTSNDCNAACTVWGGATSGIALAPGDSGSPMYQIITNGGGTKYIVPIGVLDTQGGLFARVVDALNYWGASIVLS